MCTPSLPDAAPGPTDTSHSPYAHWHTLPVGSVVLTGGFWHTRQTINRKASLPHGHQMLERAGNFHDLRLAAGLAEGPYRGPLFMDSDLYKWLEALGWELANGPDDELRRIAAETIELIAAAQADDGYLDSYYQVAEPGQRWRNLRDGHELYCAGHLIQAAVAHRRATGDTNLLHVACRFADHIYSVFGSGRRAGTPGHPEIEMALVELYRETGQPRYLELAGTFLDQRGRGTLAGGRDPAHYQDHVPVRQATGVAGHAVRQLYLLAGVTDAYLETGERPLFEAATRQWQDVTSGKLYVTGGLGSRYEGEAFGEPFELPNDRGYCETCAAIASILWNWRMLLATGEARFADLIERALLNGFLSGVSLDGRRFFYVNPLLSRGGAERAEWYSCACCPPNVMRLIASLGHYFATHDPAGLQIHQYGSATVHATLEAGRSVAVRMETDYPWQGDVRLTVERADGLPWRLTVRVPGWCEAPSVRVNGQTWAIAAGEGYATIERPWRAGDTVELDLPMVPRLIEAHPRSDAARGSVAIERGPLVYCLEDCDQPPSVNIMDVQIDETAPLQAAWHGDLLGGVMVVEAQGYAVDVAAWQERLYRPADEGVPSRQPARLVAVPYYAWANRGPGAMRVWIPGL